MNFIVKLVALFLAMFYSVSNLNISVCAEDIQQCTVEKESVYETDCDLIENLFRSIDEIQCKIDALELDVLRDLKFKLNDHLGFKKILEGKLENSSSLMDYIYLKLKISQNSKEISELEFKIEENNSLISELNEKIDCINREIIAVHKKSIKDKIVDKYCAKI